MPVVTLLAHTPQPEKLVAAAAKLCYSAADIDRLFSGLTDEKIADFLAMLTDLGHQSPLEHASFTFGIEGVSRTLLAQITRHRIASFSVQSQRYVSQSDFEYVLPPAIAEDEVAHAAFEESMREAGTAYNKLVDILHAGYTQKLEEAGKATTVALKAAQKQAFEDARFILPGASATKMILTMNARSLRGFFGQRCCNRAQWEIRGVAEEMLALCKEASPLLFLAAGPGCLRGPCPEGKMCCGKQEEVRQRFGSEQVG